MIFFHFLNIKNLAKFNPQKKEKLIEFTLQKKNSISLCKNEEILPGKKNVKQLRVFMNRQFYAMLFVFFLFKKFKDSCSNQVFFFFL
jgi:hypothetical protein